jgi:hypothetical protein
VLITLWKVRLTNYALCHHIVENLWKTNKTWWITPLTKLAPAPQFCGKLINFCGKLCGKNVTNYFWLIIYLVFLYNITHLSQSISISQDDLPFGQFIFPIYFNIISEMKLLFEHFISYRAEISKLIFNYSILKIKNQLSKCSLATIVGCEAAYNNS